jgi:hypothetical protein
VIRKDVEIDSISFFQFLVLRTGGDNACIHPVIEHFEHFNLAVGDFVYSGATLFERTIKSTVEELRVKAEDAAKCEKIRGDTRIGLIVIAEEVIFNDLNGQNAIVGRSRLVLSNGPLAMLEIRRVCTLNP